METPSDLPLPLVALYNAMVPMPSGHNILIPVKDVIARLLDEYIYKSRKDIF